MKRALFNRLSRVKYNVLHPAHAWGQVLYWRTLPYDWAALRLARARYEHLYAQPDPRPLVSVVIPTWNRAELLASRTIPSVLAQTYQNFEVVIVGDRCEDDTEERIRKIGDERLRFFNLPRRGRYPTKNAVARWQVAGAVPANTCLDLVRGKWISYLDDDDVYVPDHIEVMLEFVNENDLEFAYAACPREQTPGVWELLGDREGQHAFDLYRDLGSWRFGISHSTYFYRSYLRFFRYDLQSWRYDYATDQSLIVRMGRAGVRGDYLDRVVTYMPLRPGDTLMSQLRATDVNLWT